MVSRSFLPKISRKCFKDSLFEVVIPEIWAVHHVSDESSSLGLLERIVFLSSANVENFVSSLAKTSPELAIGCGRNEKTATEDFEGHDKTWSVRVDVRTAV
jgi:hypothetical protein